MDTFSSHASQFSPPLPHPNTTDIDALFLLGQGSLEQFESDFI